MAEVTRLERTV